MPADSPTPETSANLKTNAPQPTQEVAPTPTPTPVPDEDVAKDENEDAKQQSSEQAQKPKPGNEEKKKEEKDKKHDPMLQLVDELESFVRETNKQITDFIKDKGKAAWDSLQNTQPMKTLNGALDEAKQFMNDKIDQKVDSVYNSTAVTAARDAVNGIKDKITNSFSDLMNSAANSFANAVHKAVTPSQKNVGPSNDEMGQLANDEQATALPGETSSTGETAQADEGAQLTQSADTASASTSDMANTFGGDGSLDENDAEVSSTSKPTVGADETETATEGIKNAI